MNREDLNRYCRELAPDLDRALSISAGERVGFLLLLFDFGTKGSLAYISNAQRADMIDLLGEIRTYLEAGMTTEPRGSRGRA